MMTLPSRISKLERQRPPQADDGEVVRFIIVCPIGNTVSREEIQRRREAAQAADPGAGQWIVDGSRDAEPTA